MQTISCHLVLFSHRGGDKQLHKKRSSKPTNCNQDTESVGHLRLWRNQKFHYRIQKTGYQALSSAHNLILHVSLTVTPAGAAGRWPWINRRLRVTPIGVQVTNATLPLFHNNFANIFRLSRSCYVPRPSHCTMFPAGFECLNLQQRLKESCGAEGCLDGQVPPGSHVQS